MKRNTKVMLMVSHTIFVLSTAYANIPDTDKRNTFLGPTLNLGLTSNMSDSTAYSITGDAGVRNYRLGAALGWLVSSENRFKINAEYLRQDIAYTFFAGNTDQWVQQAAVSAEYVHDFQYTSLNPQFTLNAFYSIASNKILRTDAGSYTNSSGMVQTFTEEKHIAGSNAGGISPGVIIAPWPGGKVAAEINFDGVHYDTKYSASENISGLGGTARVTQAIAENVTVNLIGAVRQPFTNYQASIAWSNIPCYGSWTLGISGEYTIGKNTLPNTYNAGIIAYYFIDKIFESSNTQTDGIDRFMNEKDGFEFKGELSVTQRKEQQEFLSWTTKPAVFMPQVLAIADSKLQ